MDRGDMVHSVARAMSVVEILNRQPVTSLELLHRTTGVPKPTLVRLLETLIDAGYVCRVSRREGYAVTESVLRLSAGLRVRDIVVDVARPLMEAFTRQHKWQLSLGTREGRGLLIRATTRHISPFARDQLFLNRRVPILSSVIGRAYFAYCSPTERACIVDLAKGAESPDGELAHQPEKLEAIVESVRARGYATDHRGRPGPYRSFGVPILALESEDEILGSVVMFWYRSVMGERQAAQRFLQPLKELAERIAEGVAASPICGDPVERSSASRTAGAPLAGRA